LKSKEYEDWKKFWKRLKVRKYFGRKREAYARKSNHFFGFPRRLKVVSKILIDPSWLEERVGCFGTAPRVLPFMILYEMADRWCEDCYWHTANGDQPNDGTSTEERIPWRQSSSYQVSNFTFLIKRTQKLSLNYTTMS